MKGNMFDFKEFVDKKGRAARRELGIIKRMLESRGLKAVLHNDEDNPYVFLKAPNDKLSFDGIRIYKIGETLAYRIQKDEKAKPYGTAYPLNIEEMFYDFLADEMDEDKAGKGVIESVAKQFGRFFERTAEVEKKLLVNSVDKRRDTYGKVVDINTNISTGNGRYLPPV